MRTIYSIICSILLLAFSTRTYSQDIIITNDHDTLEAKVLTISESITSYKLNSYLEGPTYELSNKRINRIIYSNGEEFSFDNGSPQGSPVYNQYKNSIELVASELTMLRGSLAYSRFISKNFEIRVGASFSFVDVTESYGNNFENFGDLQLNYHPFSFRQVDYYIGLRGRIGNSRTYNYLPYYYYDEYYYPSYSNKVAGTIGMINGIRFNFTQRFAINTALSLETYIVEANGATMPLVSGVFGACYKF